MTERSTAAPDFPVVEIAAFVDATTVVLVGHNVGDLEEEDELYVLAIGETTIPKANVPLIAFKAKLEVTFPAGVYALARPPIEMKARPGTLASLITMGGLQEQVMVPYRQPLTQDERQFIGNPAKRPVAVGDVVVRSRNLADYIRWRAEAQKDKP